MTSPWHILSLLGDSRLLLPAAAVLLLAGWRSGSTWHWRWLIAVGVVATVVLASKLAFLGWGLGVARLDFTGFSGHAAMSAAIWPVLLSIALPSRWTKAGVSTGLMLAALIAYSRLPLNAHSWSEIATGWLLGAGSALWSLRPRSVAPVKLSAGWLVVALVVGSSMPLVLPEVRTHDMVTAMARTLSGNKKPFKRGALHSLHLSLSEKSLTD